MNREEKFIAFLENMKKHDPKLVNTIMEGYQTIYEGTFGKALGMLGLATGIATAGMTPDNVVPTTNKYIQNIQNEYVEDGTADSGDLINSDNNDYYAELEKLVISMKEQLKKETNPDKIKELTQTINTITRIVDTVLDNKLGVLDPADNLTNIR